MTITDILQTAGLSQTALSRELGIPLRTVQNWASGQREPPEYLVQLIAEHYHIAASE